MPAQGRRGRCGGHGLRPQRVGDLRVDLGLHLHLPHLFLRRGRLLVAVGGGVLGLADPPGHRRAVPATTAVRAIVPSSPGPPRPRPSLRLMT